jgi:hypothetical protein
MNNEQSDVSAEDGIDSRFQKRDEELERKIQEGIDSLNRGEGIPGEIIRAKFDAKFRALRISK